MKVKESTGLKKSMPVKKKEVKEHIGTLQKLHEKDPEFYEFLKEHDKELLEFNEEDVDDDIETDVEKEDTEIDDAEHIDSEVEKEEEPSRNVITSAMVDSWCTDIHESAKIGAIRSLLRAYRAACHCGDDSGDDPATKLSTMSSSVFNKIMSVVLTEMDGILRGLLKLPPSGGKKEMITELMATRRWKNYNHLVKSYLGNSLHVLNQMTDNEMIAFMLRRLKYSSVFLAAFPALLRKYVKVALHFWGTGSGALPIVSLLFLRDSCIRLGSDCLEDCIQGMYKAYVLNCHFINATKLQHIQFLGNCFIEVLRVDIPSAYQHAFAYIRQLAMILKEALSGSTRKKTKNEEKTSSSAKKKGKDASSSSASKKETFRKVYKWKFINCLELWTGVICANSSEADLMPLAYPLTQIITGTARLLPSACYFPLRLRCARMLNRISASTATFIPVSLLLLDMLDIKELRKPPKGGAGEAVDLFSMLQVKKDALKTRTFQEACVSSVVEQLAEHLAQWSYSIAFLELSFVPSVRLRNFCQSTKVDRFRREMKPLIRQIEANCDFINKKRTAISFLPNDPAAESFLEDEKKSDSSPLSKYVVTLRKRSQKRQDALTKSSVLVGDSSSKYGNKITADNDSDSENEERDGLFPTGRDSKKKQPKDFRKSYNEASEEKSAIDEDVIEDFILSSDDDSLIDDIVPDGDDSDDAETEAPKKRHGKKQNQLSKGKAPNRNSKSKKRKRSQRR